MQAAEESGQSYQNLLVKYRALQQELQNLKFAPRELDGQRTSDTYIVVLIDAHRHKVCPMSDSHSEAGGQTSFAMLCSEIRMAALKPSNCSRTQ